jgi:hypothetical protein
MTGNFRLKLLNVVCGPDAVRGATSCFSSSDLQTDALSLSTLRLCDRLVGLEPKDQELDAVLILFPSSLLDVKIDEDLGVCVPALPLLVEASGMRRVPAKWANASSASASLRVTSSMSLRRSAVMSPSRSSVLTVTLCLRCNDRSSLLSTSLLSPAASNTRMSSGRTEVSSRASSASSSLFRSVLTLLASGLYMLDGSWPDGVGVRCNLCSGKVS